MHILALQYLLNLKENTIPKGSKLRIIILLTTWGYLNLWLLWHLIWF